MKRSFPLVCRERTCRAKSRTSLFPGWTEKHLSCGLLLCLTGLAGFRGVLPAAADTGASTNATILILGIPHVKQKPDFCGEACAEMVLRKLGKKVTQDSVFNQAGVDPALGRGCTTRELVAALKKVGFNVGDVWYYAEAKGGAQGLDAQWRALCDDLRKGVPSIVCMRYSDAPATTEHFRLVIGYDPSSNEVIYHEPAEADGANRRMKKVFFLKLWPLKYDANRWTLIRLRLEAGGIREAAPARGFTPADYAQHVITLKEKIPKRGFALVIEPPFIVIGDEEPDVVRLRSRQTVGWAVKMLKQDYFTRDPATIIDVWLFRDDKSYRAHARDIFHDTPSTPFGYYSDSENALIMNIATGGGTLVHEIVHPFMRVNFPGCPAWLNEGLGSLYEQSEEKNGHIRGRTNWRLAGLQQSIRQKHLPSFEKLTGTSNSEFYNDDRGSNYAQARYLCYYLQERGLLVKFYREFVAQCQKDPTGFATLKTVLAEPDMDAFKKGWEEFVLQLSFP